ncbi:MAG: PAS domain S-box protein, partial [Cytophagales bacterium]|nr:PAS domain S-box protein [Cytophagales bacterium]
AQEAFHYRYARYYDQAPVAYFNLNAQGLIVRCNVAATRLLGYERRYLSGRGMLTLVSADDQVAFFTFFNHLAAGATTLPCRVRLRGKKGLTGPVRLEGSRLEDEAGHPEYLVAAIAPNEPTATPAEPTAPERLLREAEAVGGTGSYEADLVTMQFRFSDNLYRLLGQEPQGFVPTLDWIDSVSHPEDAARVREVLDRAVAHREPYYYQRRIYKPGGEMRYLASHGKVVCDAEGRPVKLLGTVQDITGQVRTDRILDSVDEVCFELDGNFTIRYANRRALQAWGKPAEAVTGRKMWEVHPGYWNTAVSDALLKAFREGRQVHEEIWSPVAQQWMLLNANPSPAGLIVLHFDVTDRKRAAAALQDSRELLQSVFEATPNAISVFKAVRDGAGRIVDFEWLLAGPVLVQHFAGGRELVGKRYREVFAGETAGDIMDRLVEVVETGQPADFEVKYQRQVGHSGCMRIIAVKLDDGVVATSEDVTARRQAEEQLRKHLTILQQSEELASTGSWEYDLETEHFTWSDGMYRLFGLDKARPVTPEIYADYALAEDQPVAEKLIRSLRTNPQPFEEILRIRKDGQVRVLKIKSVVTRTADGRPARVLGADLDITAIQAAEAQLEENRALLHAVIEAAPVAIAVHQALRDESGRITDFYYQFVNRETERQAGNRPLDGKRYRETFPGPRAAEWFEQFVRVVEENVPLRTERHYTVDGTDQWYLVSAVKLGDGLVVISQDVTDRKGVEAENLTLKLSQQKDLLNAILQAQEEERRRISESLHNGVGQILYATKLHLDRVNPDLLPAQVNEAIDTTGQLLAEAIRETRRVSHELVPVLLHAFGLEAAVDDFCKRFTGTGLRLTCRMVNLDDRLDPHLEVALYRISQELILNVVKHAGADQASLLLEKQAGEIRLEVNDNGKGFGPDQVPARGMGLRTIRDRVNLFNGTAEFTGTPDGVQATIRIPLPGKV